PGAAEAWVAARAGAATTPARVSMASRATSARRRVGGGGMGTSRRAEAGGPGVPPDFHAKPVYGTRQRGIHRAGGTGRRHGRQLAADPGARQGAGPRATPPRAGGGGRTIMEVARRAGVSKGAVSFALNDRPGVAPQTRDRILAAARELGWQPSTRARALSRSRAFAVGLVMRRAPELLGADPFFPQFLAGVESVLAGRGSALVLQVVADDDEAEASSYRRLATQGRVDGVFLNDLRVEERRFGLLAGLGLPAVAVGRPTGPCPFPVVTVDDRQGVAGAVEHLLGLGHRRVAFVGGTEGYVHSLSRRSAWRQALEAAGGAPGPELTADFTR